MLNMKHVRDRLGPDFRPFTIHLTDDRSFEVPHPGFIAVGRGYVAIVDEKTNRLHEIDALHIVSLDRATPADQTSDGS